MPYEVGIARYREIARGQLIADPHGMLKLLFHPDSRRLLGVHAIGTGATELIHIGQAVMAAGMPIDYFVDTVFNYPTLAECYKVARPGRHQPRVRGAAKPVDAIAPARSRRKPPDVRVAAFAARTHERQEAATPHGSLSASVRVVRWSADRPARSGASLEYRSALGVWGSHHRCDHRPRFRRHCIPNRAGIAPFVRVTLAILCP